MISSEESFVQDSNGAAAYARSPKSWVPSIPTTLTIFFVIEVGLIAISPDLLNLPLFLLLVGASIPVIAWLFVYWKIYLTVFTTPTREFVDISDERWSELDFAGWGGEHLKAFWLPGSDSSRDLVMYLHGYSSSLGRGESRCQHINSLGFHVIGFDQRGFGRQGRRYDWTLLKAVADAEALLEAAPRKLGFEPSRVFIYGHSMGGFITLRLSSHPSSWWSSKLAGVILESPVSSFPMLIDSKLPGRMVMAKPWVRHVLRREHERIHPDLNVRYANSEVPFWGVPELPFLVIQAGEDETLGLDHYVLLSEHLEITDSNSSMHLIERMPHTSEVDFAERKEIVESWLERMSNLGGKNSSESNPGGRIEIASV